MLVDPPLPARLGKREMERRRGSGIAKAPLSAKSQVLYALRHVMGAKALCGDRAAIYAGGACYTSPRLLQLRSSFRFTVPAPVEELFQIQKETYLGEEEGAEKEQQRRFL